MWSNTDAIFVNEEWNIPLADEGDSYVLEIQNQADSYTAFFPSGIVSDRDITGTNDIHVTLPSSYQYTTNSEGDQVVSVPMVAYTNAGTPVLNFVNLCALLKVEVQNDLWFLDDDPDIIVESVTLNIKNNAILAGRAVISNIASTPTLSMSSSATTKAITLNTINRTIESGGSDSYYLPVPPFTNGSNVAVLVKFNRGGVTKTMFTLADTFTAEANKIYHVLLTYSDEIEP